MIRIKLDSVIKHRNKSEYRPVNRASAEGIEIIGDGYIIRRLCQKLVDEGHTGQVEVWRDGTLVFPAAELTKWAEGKALTGEQPKHLRRKAGVA